MSDDLLAVDLGADSDRVYPNGVDAETSGHLLPPLDVETICRLAEGPPRAEPSPGFHVEERSGREILLGVVSGVDGDDLAQAGWGVLFPREVAPEVVTALRPLLEHRRGQAGALYYEFSGERGYVQGMSAFEWRRVGPRPARPHILPYYILLVGDAAAIPFEFQYQLDVIHAVGRICFNSIDDYAAYAEAVVRAETTPPCRDRRIGFFAPRNPGDVSTRRSSELLVRRLAREITDSHQGWDVEAVIGEAATKPALARMLGGEETPALLFTASHGIGFSSGNPLQRSKQGALLCQEWPGVSSQQRVVPPEHYFSAGDLTPEADVTGLVTFFFACYGLGTPQEDDFAPMGEARGLAPAPFTSALPMSMLSRGALAVIGHVDKAWGFSFSWRGAASDVELFRSTVEDLLRGHTVGLAMEHLNRHYADVGTELTRMLRDRAFGRRNDRDVAWLWLAHHDARNYAVLGDPAVRLSV
jgi:hypothetical protein